MRPAVIALALCACSQGPSEDCGTFAGVARAQVQRRVDDHTRGCSTDADCVLVRASLACYTGCLVAVTKGQEMSLASELDTLSAQLCSDTMCTVNAGCVSVVGQCVVGVCHSVEGTAPDAGSRDGG